MGSDQARLRVAVLGGLIAELGWLGKLAVPPGVSLEVVDFGYRVTVIVTQGGEEIALVADLESGDVAQSSTTGFSQALEDYARLVISERLGREGPREPQDGVAKTLLHPLIEASGGIRVPLYTADDASGCSDDLRTVADE
jgi:hypothetical protein